MAERDQTPVVIRLDRQRAYRRRDEDRNAVWVGPGRVTVPKWVAEHWGASILKTAPANALAAPPTPPPSDLPTDGGNQAFDDELDDEDVDEEEGEAEEQAISPPKEDYDSLNVDQILFWADTLDDAGRARVVAYEKANKNRKTIIEELE